MSGEGNNTFFHHHTCILEKRRLGEMMRGGGDHYAHHYPGGKPIASITIIVDFINPLTKAYPSVRLGSKTTRNTQEQQEG